MLKDRATAEDDFWYFCKRCTPFSDYRITERNHPMKGELWIDHPFQFWFCRQLQEITEEPPEGWVWFKFHRDSHKTTTILDWMLWLLARDESETIGMWTHKTDEIGEGMGRGLLTQLEENPLTQPLRDYWPQFRNLQQAKAQGFTVDRLPGPREQSVTIASILTSMTSIHPRRYVLDDVVTERLRDNPEQIQRVAKNISALAALLRADSPVVVVNTPWDEADPLVQREKDGLFAKVYEQSCYLEDGEANLHTKAHFVRKRKEINDDSIYFPQFELRFHRQASVIFDWKNMSFYDEPAEQIAAQYPFINIIVDGAGGGKDADFTVIRVATWTAHDSWANLELIRERVGWTKAAQILLGRDPTDPSTDWIQKMYTPNGVGVIERWMKHDPRLILWFDEAANQGWTENFKEMCRLRSIRFSAGKLPTLKAVPQEHLAGYGMTKLKTIKRLEGPYDQGKASYPRKGFGHGSHVGLAGEDSRDTMVQFRQDEFDRMKLNKLPPHDDGLDTEKLMVTPDAVALMRRPREKKGGVIIGGREYPVPTVSNPFGIRGGGATIQPAMGNGRSWVSM